MRGDHEGLKRRMSRVGKRAERKTAGCKRGVSPVSQNGLDLVLSPEKKKDAPALFTPSKPNRPKFKGTPLSATL